MLRIGSRRTSTLNLMKPFSSITARRMTSLFGVAVLLAVSSAGCQCCRLTERYQDCVDHVCDIECNAQVLYRPWYDLTRIGRIDSPWCRGRRCRPAPGFAYHTPVTNEVMSRSNVSNDPYSPSTIAPPPLLPDDVWSEPDPGMNRDDVGVAPVGPMFEPDFVPPPAPLPNASEPAVVEPDLDTPPASTIESTESEFREPTPAAPQRPASNDMSLRRPRDDSWTRASGVVELFEATAESEPAAGITIHHYDHSDYAPIALETWLSDEPEQRRDVETASGSETPSDGVREMSAATTTMTQSPFPWAANEMTRVGDEDLSSEVRPSAATQSPETTPQTNHAQWWEAQPTRADRTANDVFGLTPFAEWQSATE